MTISAAQEIAHMVIENRRKAKRAATPDPVKLVPRIKRVEDLAKRAARSAPVSLSIASQERTAVGAVETLIGQLAPYEQQLAKQTFKRVYKEQARLRRYGK